MSEIRDKLLKEEYRSKEDLKKLPIIALLDINEDEVELLKEFQLETIEDLSDKWSDHYDKIAKKIPKERINSWIAASRLVLVEEKEKVSDAFPRPWHQPLTHAQA